MEKKRDETSSSSTISSKKLLKDLIHKKIRYYLSKAYLEDTDLYNVFKEFFTELLELKYEFTCGELLNELNKVFLDKSVRAKTVKFIDKIKLIEYKQNAYNNEDIRKLFNEFDDLVNLLISKTLVEPKKGIFSFLFHKAKDDTNRPFFQKITDTQSQAPGVLSANTQSAKDMSSKPVEKDKNNHDELSDILSGESSVNNLNSKEENKVSSNDVDIDEFNHETDLVSDSTTIKSAIHTMAVNDDFTKEPIKKTKVNKKSKKADSKDIDTLFNKAKKIKSKNKLKEIYSKALSAYNALDNKNKSKYYSKLNKLYKQIV